MARTPEQFIVEMHKINPEIEVIGVYTKALERVTVKCQLCNNIWEPKAYSLLQGKGCPSCSAKRGASNNKGKTGLKTTEKFIKDLILVDPTINVIGTYQNGHTDIELCCSKCGHLWTSKPYSVLQGHGCPRCAKSGTSFMEQLILLCFRENIGYDKVISRDKKAIGMELDIYIPDLKIAFEPGNWLLHRNSLERDKKKRMMCANKGIRLITIYDKYPANTQPPFNDNIYTFVEDLNIADHALIRQLIQDLFNEADINANISDIDWSKLEQTAYENAKAMGHEEFVKRMQIINPSIQIIGQYRNANRRILVQCINCKFEWDAVPANLLSGDGCKKCGTRAAHKKTTKTNAQFIAELATLNPDVEIIGKYVSRHSPVKARCKICGLEWYPVASSLLRGSSHKGSTSEHKRLQQQQNN